MESQATLRYRLSAKLSIQGKLENGYQRRGLTLPSSKSKVLVMEPVSMPVVMEHLLEMKVCLLGVPLLTARSTGRC
jgi:hypothetical protein